MLNIVLFGPPGAGKGTQSQKLITQYNLVHLSTGDLLRAQIAQGTELGLTAKKLMDEGLLVPDAVVIGMIGSALETNPQAGGQGTYCRIKRGGGQVGPKDFIVDGNER